MDLPSDTALRARGAGPGPTLGTAGPMGYSLVAHSSLKIMSSTNKYPVTQRFASRPVPGAFLHRKLLLARPLLP